MSDTRNKGKGVLPLGKVGLVVGAGGVSKTMAGVRLGVSVATGEPWLGVFSVATPGRALLVLGEEEQEEAHRRLFNSTQNPGANPAPGSIVVMPLAGIPCALLEKDERGNTMETPFLPWFRQYLKANSSEAEPWRLIYIDPLSRFAGLDAEKDNAEATRFIQAVESIATATGATVILAHHSNKASRAQGGEVTGDSSRGSSALHDGARWVATLAPVPIKDDGLREKIGAEAVRFAVVKSNYALKPEPILLRRDDNGMLVPLHDADHDEVMRSGDGRLERAQKQAAKERERDERFTTRDAKEAERRETKEALAATKLAARIAAIDAAVLDSVRTFDGLTEKHLLAAVRAKLGQCSDASGRAAILRVIQAGAIVTQPGPNNSRTHHLSAPKAVTP